MMTSARRIILALLAAASSAWVGPELALASHTQESVFQDDASLIYNSTANVNRTLGVLESLGVQRLRVTVKWSVIAPAATSRVRPPHFNAANPADYPPAGWTPYDRLLELAAWHGIGVEFNITAPGPLWAMSRGTPTERAADHWAPDWTQFAEFVYALGKRYSGTYRQLPRVDVWSVWNEPNQPGWLAPQSRKVGGRQVPNSPRLYRQYVEGAALGLYYSGHLFGKDTLLIGELAPEGYKTPGFYTAMTPMPFLRALYCLDGSYHPLRGSRASALDCPTRGSAQAFVKANPGLFYATGFAHHPYDFFLAPSTPLSDPDTAPLANLGRLQRGLDRAFRAYRIHRKLPIYITEYGYQTNPPDPYQVVTPAKQAAYLNEADYIAWRNPRVRSVGQFLLYDSGPDTRYRPSDFKFWDTFQTGLLYANGAAKPAFAAYRMPIWVPQLRTRPGGKILIWGQLRAATHLRSRQQAEVQWRGRGRRFRTLSVASTNRLAYLTVSVRPPGSGEVRLAWRSPQGRLLVSRSVQVSVG